MNLFFKEMTPSKNLSIWVDNPNYGVMLEDNSADDLGFSQLKYTDELEVRHLVNKLCKLLKLPKEVMHVEIDISFK